jgi:hypothetical protein
MRKRQRKKLEKMVGNTERVVTALEAAYSSIMTISQALQTMIREIQSYLTRFPMKVEDWATNPPLHNGEYIIWFVKKDQETESRKYTFAGGKWYGNQGEEIDIRKYKPSMWMLLPTFDPGVIEIYKRRQE